MESESNPLVLVIDDDGGGRLLLASVLGNAGFRTAEAADGEAGLAEFVRLAPDIVLLDVVMPKLDGFAVCEAIRQLPQGRFTPVLMMTGLDDTDSINRAYAAGATDFITKPIIWELLGHRVRYMLRASRTQAEREHLAAHDALTGLVNRLTLDDRLQQAINYAERYQGRVCVALIDLDRFKLINDTLGHHVGDALLQQVAGRLIQCVRESDTVARLGGDEFVLVLFERDGEGLSASAARRILHKLAQPYVLDGREFNITCSIGLSLYPVDGDDAETLLKHADAAMYRAKESGRNGFCFYTPEMHSEMMRRLTLESELRQALEQEQFELYYQPQVDLTSGEVAGLEALIRWRHPQHGLVSPAQFIGLAEETGLIVPIGEWVLHAACRQSRAWQQAGLSAVPVAVNLSAKQFMLPGIDAVVGRALSGSGLAPGLLELELTESLSMDCPERTIPIMRAFKSMGVQLAIDDFGTGYSNLTYLKHFPVDRLKLDKSFVNDIVDNRDDEAIARAVVDMAHCLRLNVLAEGVETIDQLWVLVNLGCRYVQGYLFSRPLPPDECARVLADGTIRRLALDMRR
jgi:diguanylate cyclase (GGDEF)-like protein